MQEAALIDIRRAGLLRVGIEQAVQIPASVLREAGHTVPALADQPPQVLGARHTAWKAARHTHDRYRLRRAGGPGPVPVRRRLPGRVVQTQDPGPKVRGEGLGSRVVEGHGGGQTQPGPSGQPVAQLDDREGAEAEVAEGPARRNRFGARVGSDGGGLVADHLAEQGELAPLVQVGQTRAQGGGDRLVGPSGGAGLLIRQGAEQRPHPVAGVDGARRKRQQGRGSGLDQCVESGGALVRPAEGQQRAGQSVQSPVADHGLGEGGGDHRRGEAVGLRSAHQCGGVGHHDERGDIVVRGEVVQCSGEFGIIGGVDDRGHRTGPGQGLVQLQRVRAVGHDADDVHPLRQRLVLAPPVVGMRRLDEHEVSCSVPGDQVAGEDRAGPGVGACDDHDAFDPRHGRIRPVGDGEAHEPGPHQLPVAYSELGQTGGDGGDQRHGALGPRGAGFDVDDRQRRAVTRIGLCGPCGCPQGDFGAVRRPVPVGDAHRAPGEDDEPGPGLPTHPLAGRRPCVRVCLCLCLCLCEDRHVGGRVRGGA
ncbi:hypothetical protein Saso_51380 [Streptomyces asoensis]|uniref:Uncharacterized protein n=1 Tax=Streptomyces asoensis TaxID=249586 RepID=A0ABQ3S5U0_9ACTN|nr:hypothetical protein Saso_51380 [Streptomyces asoensis]